MVPLPVSQSLGGVGTGVSITHRGYLKVLPPHLSLCYYSADARANLISLGFIQEQGGMFGSVGSTQLLVADRGGVQIDLVRQGSNRLSIVSSAVVSSVWSSVASLSAPTWSPLSLVAPSVIASFLAP